MPKLSKQTLNVINISLVLISSILILNLFGFQIPNLGYAIQDAIDTEQATCFASYDNQASEINLDLCCQEAKKQLSCIGNKQVISTVETDVQCSTGTTTIKYHLTDNAYRYCQNNYY
ncbi:hypothetical protein HOA92_03925 [archaeon]|jgi:hypothetical protein|nr:hypothetical protein [archaeon]MBT6762161.1 hypothetical protein [archaeon]